MLKDEVLALLEQRDTPCSGSEMARALGVTRAAVWKAVEALRVEGYHIESATNRGYKLAAEQDILSASRIASLLHTRIVGHSVEILDVVDSTNNYLKEAARNGAPEGLAAIADRQTGGKGRMGRTFQSPPGTGVYLSVLLRPRLPVTDCTILTVAAAVCTCRAIEQVTGLRPQIKWVNDLMIDGKKLCGILTEAAMEFESGMAEFVVVGIGVNVKPLDGLLSEEVRSIAVSLDELAGGGCFRNRLIAAILNELDGFYADIPGNRGEMLREYSRRMFLTGRQVRIAGETDGRAYTVLGIDDGAHLIVQDPTGNKRVLSSGEVSVVPLPAEK